MRFTLPHALALTLSAILASCSSSPTTTPATSDVPAVTDARATDAGAADAGAADAGDEFAGAPTCSIGGFMSLRGAAYMGEAVPPSAAAVGRPTLTQGADASSLRLTDATGAQFILDFGWSGTLRADQPGNLTSAQIYLPMDQGAAAPPLDGPWANKRICAGAGSRIVLRPMGIQFILRNATVTEGACPGGTPLGPDVIEGCYAPNIAP